MTKRDQFRNNCLEYLDDLKLMITFANDEELAVFAKRNLPCAYCACIGTGDDDSVTHCENHVLKYLQEHGDEEVEEC